MRIAIGSDHAGFVLKEHLKETLLALGHEVDDYGTHSEASVDYPPICAAVGRAVTAGRADRGIVLGGSGQGEQIAANKVRGVRAALCNDLFTARLSRQHNDANVLSMGGRIARNFALKHPERIFFRSDHYSYAVKGIPILFWFDGVSEHYHQVTDHADTIDYQKIERVGRTVFATAWDLANANNRPKVDMPLPE